MVRNEPTNARAKLQPSTLDYDGYLARKHVPELDGLRGWSILLVIGAHMPDHTHWGWLGGRFGVAVFFVLSGYLITTLALREEARRGVLCLRAFYVRRCFRIFPLYYLALAIYCFYILVLGIHAETKPALLGALPYLCLYFQEVLFSHGLSGIHTGIPFYQSWSLGVEEKFYLVWPLIAFVLWRGTRAIRLLGTAALLIAFALPPVLGLGRFGECLYPHYLILTGCLAAFLLDDRRWFQRLRFLGAGPWTYIAAGTFLVLHFAHPYLPESYWHCGDPVYALGIGLLLISVLLGESLVSRSLRLAPLTFIGRVSYGVYLIHILCRAVASRILPDLGDNWMMQVVLYATTCILSVAAAYLLALAVERPLIEVGRRWSNRILARTAERANGKGPAAERAGASLREPERGKSESHSASHVPGHRAVAPAAKAG
jgi:peptidoglycan/LPS O-acetylase OafA/YrhL